MPDESLVIKFHGGEHGVASVCAAQLVFARRHAVDRYKEPAAVGYPLRNCVRQLYAHYRAAARLISSSDAGFSNAEVSPSFSPRYVARTIRRITFAFRVFGMSPTKITSRGAKALPRSCATLFFNSVARALSPLAFFFNTQKQTNASPLMESGTPTAAASLTSGCATRTDSTSAGPTRLPASLIVSSERPRMYQR